ncbi:MAG: polysaccharide deacetylase family protein [Cytophagales bacterium]
MNLIPHKTPKLLKWIYGDLLWEVNTTEKVVYLTFDDGPIPEVTPFVLETLRMFNAKATFFCVGENVVKHPDVFQQLIDDGHTVGNHTHNHVKGWEKKTADYVENIMLCEKAIEKQSKKLFRPPYGRITRNQINVVKQDYTIVMWDVLSADYEKSVSAESCLKNTLFHTKPGSIVLFHDHQKTYEKIKFVLPRYLNEMSKRGFRFEALNL